jgi:hypothetical protein
MPVFDKYCVSKYIKGELEIWNLGKGVGVAATACVSGSVNNMI